MSHSTTTKAREGPSIGPPSVSSTTAGLRYFRSPWWRAIGKFLPTTAVIVMLISLAAWGNLTGWKMPSFAVLTGSEGAPVEDWCSDHNVPASQCIECNPALVPALKDHGWCKVHGIAQCPLEHSEVAQLANPPKMSDETAHRVIEALSLRPREQNNPNCRVHNKRIQFASIAAIEKAGVDIALVQQRPIIEAISANGEIVYDETHSARLTSRTAGTVRRVLKQVADRVQQGDVLALIDSNQVGNAKAELLQAIARLRLAKSNVDRIMPLANTGVVAGQQLVEANAALQEEQISVLRAEQQLGNLGFAVSAQDFDDTATEDIVKRIQFLGLSPELVASLGNESTSSNLLPLRSPLNGVIVRREVVAGEAQYLSLGQTVLFRPTNSASDLEVKGQLAWISTATDDETRTVQGGCNKIGEAWLYGSCI